LATEALTFFFDMLGEVIPVLVIVFALIFLFELFLNPRRVETYLGATSGLRGWAMAVGAGILATGPVYAWYALLGELRAKGMKASLAAAFLYARALKFPLLPLLVHYFGLTYTLVLSVYLVIAALLSGLFMEWIERSAARESQD
jgi:uncharacterized membrane protein YraQ (UPF0718 family)